MSKNKFNAKTNILDVEVKNHKECGWCTDNVNKQILRIPWTIWSQWLYLMSKYKDKEWGAVYWIRDNTLVRWHLPTQEVTGASCEFEEDCGGDGMVHSHHTMGAFHSGQDDEQARNLYGYSIVLSTKAGALEYVATRRVELPCQGFGYVDVDIELIGMPDVDVSKIHEDTYVAKTYDYSGREWDAEKQEWKPVNKKMSSVNNNETVEETDEEKKLREKEEQEERDRDNWWKHCESCNQPVEVCQKCKYYDNWNY